MGFVRRIVNLYRTQIELLWRWRSGRRALIKRTLVALVASVIAFNITAWLLPQLDINELEYERVRLPGRRSRRAISTTSTTGCGRILMSTVER